MDRMIVGLCDVKFAEGGSDADPATEVDRHFKGYGAVFGNVDAHGDVIAPGAFTDTIAAAKKSGRWPAMLLQHGGWGVSADDLMPVGVWTSIEEDAKGLPMTGVLAPTARATDAYHLMKMQPRPAIDGLSIGYIPRVWESGDGKTAPRRTLKKVDLIEVSLVTFPANGKARITSVKSLDDIATLADAETMLREAAGFSRAQAVAFIARVKSAARLGDQGVQHDDGSLQELREALERRGTALRAMLR